MSSWAAEPPLAATTAASAAATAPAAAISATTTTAARPFFASAGKVNGEVASVEVGAVHGTDGFLGFFFGAHGDESESARAAAVAIGHEVGFEDGAVRGESILEIVFGGVEGKISNKQFIIHA
jgi:hypothetical protein